MSVKNQTHARWLTVLLTLALGVAPAVACKSSKSGKKKKNDNEELTSSDPRTTTPNTRRDQPPAGQGSTAGPPALLIGGQPSGSTISVSSATLNLPVQISGGSGNYMVGVLSGPPAVTMANTGGEYRVAGQLPAFVSTPHQLVIVARDVTRCGTAPDCNIQPNGQGKIPQSQFKLNPAYDSQANVQLQLSGTGGGFLGNGNGNGGGSGGSGGGIFRSTWDRIKQWFTER